MDFYRDIITAKSWDLLQELRKKFPFILIGGWAVWLYTKRLKSKDIDIIISPEVLSQLKEKYPHLSKNDRLKKYEIIEEAIHIDIYVPFYSRLGVDQQTITFHTHSKDGFIVPKPEILLMLKLVAYQSRKGSSKGQKDLLDIISILMLPEFDFARFYSYADTRLLFEIKQIFLQFSQIPQLGLNTHHFSKLKKILLNKLDNPKNI
jgi:hypothetical protein